MTLGEFAKIYENQTEIPSFSICVTVPKRITYQFPAGSVTLTAVRPGTIAITEQFPSDPRWAPIALTRPVLWFSGLKVIEVGSILSS